uniref:DNK domain-containing protein n=1 Tax=Macrostomum lignano TaxID=282301 RepID=A0A1I8FM75_9PLAT
LALKATLAAEKTSLVAELKRRINNGSLEPLKFVDEPVEKWTDFNGINLLQLMYSDPIRWSNLFQAYVMLTMVDGIARPTLVSEGPCLIERTLHSRQLESCDYEILCQWYKSFIENQLYHLDLIRAASRNARNCTRAGWPVPRLLDAPNRGSPWVVLARECSPEQLNEQWDRLLSPVAAESRKVAEALAAVCDAALVICMKIAACFVYYRLLFSCYTSS